MFWWQLPSVQRRETDRKPINHKHIIILIMIHWLLTRVFMGSISEQATLVRPAEAPVDSREKLPLGPWNHICKGARWGGRTEGQLRQRIWAKKRYHLDQSRSSGQRRKATAIYFEGQNCWIWMERWKDGKQGHRWPYPNRIWLKKKKRYGSCAFKKKIGNSFYIDFGDVVVPKQSSLRISMQIPGSWEVTLFGKSVFENNLEIIQTSLTKSRDKCPCEREAKGNCTEGAQAMWPPR